MSFGAWLDSLLYYCLLWSVASARAPTMVYFNAYATVDENTFYIQGGTDVTNSSITYNQFFSLDLTRSWNTSNPPWSEVITAAGGRMPARLKASFHSMSLSKDKKTLTFWDLYNTPPYGSNFHLDTNKWEDLSALPAQIPDRLKVLKAATDATTDRVYIPGGAPGNEMLAYDPFSKAFSVIAVPPGGTPLSWSTYTFAWNEVRRSFLYFGGYEMPGPSYFYEYAPAAAIPWTALTSSGSVPPQLSNSCMVSAYDGAKMIVFGGTVIGKIYGSLYILDVPTMTWSLGPSSQPRMAMSCSVSGDNFIVWGGVSWNESAKTVLLPATPVIYNMYSAQWKTNFISKQDTAPRLVPTTPPSSTGSGESGGGGTETGVVIGGTVTGPSGVENPVTAAPKSNNAAIIGGSASAGIVIVSIAVMVGVVVIRRRRNSRRRVSLPMEFWNI
ncbi:hypothetical protein K457DRAFT_37218 [Linnemannia elongata AG-77]|uniref:Galactose oxidase n=1 Tax=Linnemannia elongata AG-77 TaxID=1314771 RepID=A0A197JD93_9FUNG|nr:hypothetical protein K457DRAFT_1911819 [Linnemannia elongata AG-77]OAQ22419.1 hypothetical protein K457DRAFT_37218 [Linnemannia elongata AG-77]